MRRYTTDHISKLIAQMREDRGVLRLAEKHNELERIWATIPDPTLRRLEVELLILSEEGVLRIVPASSVALNYLRGQRKLIEEHLALFMQTEKLSTLEIVLR